MPSQPSRPPHHAAASWPHIQGIDTDDVCERLGGDAALFRLMLRRWLAEVSANDFALVLVAADAGHDSLCADHAARAHDLRGVAGLLGAAAIAQQAAVVEAACRAGDAPRAAEASQQLAQQLRQLAHDAAPYTNDLSPSSSPRVCS
jgi:HPt (histidine-containing phosphotransfer) domain-containing protein